MSVYKTISSLSLLIAMLGFLSAMASDMMPGAALHCYWIADGVMAAVTCALAVVIAFVRD